MLLILLNKQKKSICQKTQSTLNRKRGTVFVPREYRREVILSCIHVPIELSSDIFLSIFFNIF